MLSIYQNYLNRATSTGLILLFVFAMSLTVGCGDDHDIVEPPSPTTRDKIIGTWKAEGNGIALTWAFKSNGKIVWQNAEEQFSGNYFIEDVQPTHI